MAKQVGDIKITGTVAGVTFYKMDGQYYARRKSSLEGKRVKRDPRFRRTMEWAQRLARGSQLASQVYRSLPRHQQAYALFCTLKSAAIRGLKEGKSEAEVLQVLKVCLAAGSGGNSTEQTKVSYTVKTASMNLPAPHPEVAGKPKATTQRKQPLTRMGTAPPLVVGADGRLSDKRRGRRKIRNSCAQGTRRAQGKRNTGLYDKDPVQRRSAGRGSVALVRVARTKL